MKNQFYTLITLVLVIIALTAVYFIYSNEDTAPPPNLFYDDDIIILINRPRSDMQKVVFSNPTDTFTLTRKASDNGDETWISEEHPDITLDTFTVNSMLTLLYYLSPYELLTDSPSDYAEFGLDTETQNPAVATAYYTDGTTETVIAGDKAPGGDFYYLKREGDPSVYLLFSSYGARLYYSYDNMISRRLHTVNPYSIYKCVVYENGEKALEMHFEDLNNNTDHATFIEHMNTVGETFLTMQYPYEGRLVYLSAFLRHLEGSFEGYKLGALAELKCTDFSSYGLSSPSLSIYFEDYEGSLSIEVGDYADEEQTTCYVRVDGKDSVFIMDAKYLECFRGMNTVKFIERFIIEPLPNIGTVDKITISAPERGELYDILINHADDEPDITGVGDIAPTVNGVSVNAEDFRMFYRAIIGLLIEGTAPEFTLPADADITISFIYHTDRESTVNRFYSYDTNFYAAQGDEGYILVSKQLMRVMFEYLEKLL